MIRAAALLLAVCAAAGAQEPAPFPTPAAAAKTKPSLRDSLDGAFDLSDRLIESHGFVPVPIVVTEPALGGFGGGLAPVFLKKKAPRENQDGKSVPIPPDITALAGLYTANGTWLGGGMRRATLDRQRLRYRVAAGYVDMNIDFYATLPSGEERAFGFNGRLLPFFAYLAKELRDPRFTLGAQYTFAQTKMNLADPGELPPSVTPRELDSVISSLGAVAEFDGRDNIFTPDSGLKLHAHFDWSDDWLGSDYQYGRLNAFGYWYTPIGRRGDDGRGWISGLRFDLQQAFGDPPFYLLPYVDMRGIPAVRYQGRTDLLLETDQRFDVTRRFSLVLFGGVAKAFDAWADASDADWLYTGGAGVRYLIARKFKLRMGLDVARGPEEWAYYIGFGSSWFK